MSINPNDHAFPCLDHTLAGLSLREPGLTIRAEIAARVLAGIAANSLVGDHHQPRIAIAMAVELADLLIAELNKEKNDD